MKTLYSSSFLSIILAFFTLLSMQGKQPEIVKSEPIPTFTNIIRPAEKTYSDKVNIEVFYTFGCPECSDFGLNTIPALMEEYKEDEKVNLQIYLNPDMDDEGQYYPAVGVKCAEEYDKYLEMHQKLNLTTETLGSREADLLGQELGFPVTEFRNCLKSGKYDDFYSAVNDVAAEKGVKKMPVTYINGYRLTGDQPIENIEMVVDEIQNYKITKLQD